MNEHDTLYLWRLIEQLRQEEGASLELCCSNPDFNHLPHEMITFNAAWTGWKDLELRGDTLLAICEEALRRRTLFQEQQTVHDSGNPATEPECP